MQGKRRTGTTVSTERAAHAALRRAPGHGLAPDEERVLRMRLGASAPGAAPLERLTVASDAEIELLAYEIEAWHRLEPLRRAAPARTAVHAAAPATSRAKERIVRALGRKR